ncbi:alpha/beta hydrolase [Kribbella sp. NBC_01245]|uniref:alpha/beta hydrolase n=1 Tax=Kribbella sp. NBC_01245 TaxID=2903578 RepID=UPI002E2AFBBF|nr:alpha/beta hydrolase [Kribbella sp. NBC_01245]
MKFRALAASLGAGVLALTFVSGPGAVSASADLIVTVQPTRTIVAERYLEQELSWRKCGEPALRTQCALVTVPRDWSNQSAGVDLEVAISKVAPKKGKPSRIVVGNPGGPGAPGLGMAPFLASRPALAKGHLAVGFDPRGTGDSTTITCDGSPLFTMDARDRDGDNLDLIADAAELTSTYCERQSRGLLPYITTEQTVKDLDLVRALLGFEQLDFIGYSGGTWLGAYYQTYFPEHVGRFVLDSNTDFTQPWQHTFEAQPEAFERRFREDFAGWAARYHAQLRLGKTAEQVVRFYERLRAKLKQEPAVESFLDGMIKVTYDQNTLDGMIANSMYSKLDFQTLAEDMRFINDLRDTMAKKGRKATQRKVDALPDVVQKAHAKRAQRAMSRRSGPVLPLAEDSSNSTFFAITCNDTEWPQGQGHADDVSAELGPQYPLLGWSANENPCYYWDRPSLDMPVPDGEGLPTTLMVQSDHDPATNASLAVEAHEQYAGSRLVRVAGEGDHGIYGGINPCVDKVVDAFLTTGRSPVTDVVCQGTGIPAPRKHEPEPEVAAARTAAVTGYPLARIADYTNSLSGF